MWYHKNERGNTYSAGQSYTVPDYGINGIRVTFTANWRAERYDVIYVKGNGENNSTGSVNYGSSLSLLSAPSRTGYSFTGWVCDRGKSVNNLTATHGGTVTLYAQWQATWATQARQPIGSGTVASPYKITSANELAWLASQNNLFSGQRFTWRLLMGSRSKFNHTNRHK